MAIVLGAALTNAGAAAAADRPNFVVMYADDWRWDALGVVQREQGERGRWPWLATPRMDALAAEAMRFRQSFVVNSLCSPGRACVLTGQYSHINGVINNRTPLPADAVTVATRLHEAGYRNAYCGKWHMGGQRERPGFDYVASFVGQGRYVDCPILLNGQRVETRGRIDDVSTDHAVKFLKDEGAQQPFFLFLGFKSVHSPRGGENLPERARGLFAGLKPRPTPNLDVPAVYLEGAARPARRARRNERRQEGHRDYMRHVAVIDDCVGRVLDALDETGLAANTIVIVASDNGYYLGEHGVSDKRTAYEESLRVPLLVRVPGEEARQGTSDAMVLNVDYGPTILDFAGAEPLPGAHGRSLRPLLEGAQAADWRRAFFYEYFQERGAPQPTVLAVRTATHKLITYPGHEEWTEAYDVAQDPYETKNLVQDAALVAELRGEFEREAGAVGFQMPGEIK